MVNSRIGIADQSVYIPEMDFEERHSLSWRLSDSLIKRSVTVLFSVSVLALSPAARSGELRSLESIAVQCLRSFDLPDCRGALEMAETLQRRASSRDAYPCQTLLLGLQADLIMQQLGEGRGAIALNDLQATIRGCAGL